MRPLAGPDARLFDLIVRVAHIATRHGLGTAADIVRLAYDHLPHPHALDRALRTERARADKAEQETVKLRARVVELEHALLRHTAVPISNLPPLRVVVLSRSQYEVFSEYCEGKSHNEIAAELGLALGTVKNYVSHVAELLQADSTAHAAALVNRQVVAIQARAGKRAVA